MRVKALVFSCVLCTAAVWTGLAVGSYSTPTCNSLRVNEDTSALCGSPTPCSPYTGPGSCTGTCLVQRPLQGSCVAGTGSTYCEATPWSYYRCTNSHDCQSGVVPNPDHDPEDPESPAVLDACVAGYNNGVNSWKYHGQNKQCVEAP
jgi:hypothetical protein